MKLYSTNDKNNIVDLKEAVLNAFPKDRGLYMPTEFNSLDRSFLDNLSLYSFKELSFIVAQKLIGAYIPESDLYKIIDRAIDFPAPVVSLNNSISTLELFHGPTMAFKDFGARFMAELMSYFLVNENRETTILVATSGDTGGAVAAGFHKVPGINVIILYPSGKVSPLQEKQLTTWGDNISAIEIEGVFDDCQALVKNAFVDQDLKKHYSFSSANSINIARLIPQSFYYFEAYKQLVSKSEDLVFCVPSGNFGNLTAGLLAHKIGLPIKHFIAATNVNDTVPEYLLSGEFKPKPSKETISNAMDVGNPSNFPRILELLKGTDESSTWNNIKNLISGFSYSDEATSAAIKEIKTTHNYIADPHGAIGYLACQEYLKNHPKDHLVFLETAHPGKFSEPMEEALGPIDLPESLISFVNKKKVAKSCSSEYNDFKELLL